MQRRKKVSVLVKEKGWLLTAGWALCEAGSLGAQAAAGQGG